MKTPTPGPKPLTIEEYRRRHKGPVKEVTTPIASPKKPKRRGGYLVTKRRQISQIKRVLDSSPPPPWDISTRLWLKIEELERAIKIHKFSRDLMKATR